MSQMINSGQIIQDSERSIVLKGAQGDQSFVVDQPQQQVDRQLDMDGVFHQEDQDLNS